MCSCGPPHMANQKQDDQLEHTYSNYVMVRDGTLRTCQRQWMIGRRGERGSGISVLATRHDDDDDDVLGYLIGSIVNSHCMILPLRLMPHVPQGICYIPSLTFSILQTLRLIKDYYFFWQQVYPFQSLHLVLLNPIFKI